MESEHVKASSLRLGPKGLGDPDDMSLRSVERQVKIPQKLRDQARLIKCTEEVKAFNECCIENGISMVYKCRKPNDMLKECLAKWFNDKDFINECTKEYLKERSDYRRTGIPAKRYYRIPQLEKE